MRAVSAGPPLEQFYREHHRRLFRYAYRQVRREVPALMCEAYSDANKDAVDKTGLPVARLPADCPYAADDLLAEGFSPEAELGT